MIVLDRVTKCYPARGGTRTILNEVSLVFEPGVNVGILGRNGAGKSTLVRLLAKAEEPTHGSVHHLRSVSWPLGFAGGFQGNMTARDNVRFVAGIYGAPYRETVAQVEDFAELGSYLDMPVSTFSSGMRARLAFGLSMAIQFDFYLMDELTAVGDARFKERAQQAFQELRDKATFILVSHHPAQVRQLCHIVYLIDGGHLTRFDDVKKAINVYKSL